MEIVKAKFNNAEAFVYTTERDNKYLAVSNDLKKSRLEEIKKEAKDIKNYIWIKRH